LSGFARQAFVAALSCSAPKPRAHIRVRPLGGTGVHRTPVAFRLAPGLTVEWPPSLAAIPTGPFPKAPAMLGSANGQEQAPSIHVFPRIKCQTG
ncbi:hypothetical protein CAI21_21045, partial [Alkalilimnicola ehrlichii]|uniref:hypothetical protein n=1 Tax=Alkalilimnicola ehrlichii TaxID=351052 RepID=UPI000E365375